MKDYIAGGIGGRRGRRFVLEGAALAPGIVIGGAAILAPNLLPGLRRTLRPLLKATTAPPKPAPAAPKSNSQAFATLAAPARLGLKRAIAKTITFRIIVTALDFTANYIVLGELRRRRLAFSAFSLVAGPIFYFAHETAWNYFGGTSVETPIRLRLYRDAEEDDAGRSLTISQALAKTITFRAIASTVEFTATYVVVGDFVTAAGLSALGLIFGPFVYYGHEWLWDRYAPPQEVAPDAPVLLLPPPNPLHEPLSA